MEWNEEIGFQRTVEEVRTVIGHAKLVEDDLKPVSQVVSFSHNLLGDEVKLVQVSKQMAESIEKGDILTFRGEEEEGVVLCTKDKTYDVKHAETSNSMLILPQLSFSEEVGKEEERTLQQRSVSGVFYKYLEIKEIRPKLQKLRDLLNNNILDENTARGGEGGVAGGLTRSTLLDIIQASEVELEDGLKTMEAVQYKGKWFGLDQEFQMKALSFLLRFFDENSWRLDCVQKQESLDTLKDLVDQHILSQVFDMYCEPMLGGEADQFSLDKSKVARFYGDYLLSPGTNFTEDEFLDMWQKAVPEGIKTDISQLSGLALIDLQSNPTRIRRFAEGDLPNNIPDRLDALFSARARWNLEDISPFIQPLTTPKQNVNALLTKHARAVNSAGTKFFCAKHGK
jgi:sister chromatid cohesion protein DCC1